MTSPFNVDHQAGEINSKIVVALERLSEAFRVLLWDESKRSGLSPIQIQLLIFVLSHPGEKCKITYLAKEFNLSKPTISESVKSLLEKALIRKCDDPADTRSYTIGLTEAGKHMAMKAAHFAFAIEEPLRRISEEQKEAMLTGLLNIIHDLTQSGIITIQRMCFTCSNYRVDQGGHYCTLLQARLAADALRVDCNEHAPLS